MNWKPEKDEKPLTTKEFLAIAEKKYPGISRSPHLRRAFNDDFYEVLEALEPVRARSQARKRGYSRPLSDEQQIQVLKKATGTRTYRRRKNPARLTKKEKRVRALVRRNSVYDTNAENAWKAATKSIYQSHDLPVLAAREALQNSVDAIREAVKKRQIRKGEGVFEVVVDTGGRWIEFIDNGTGMNRSVVKTFFTLNQSGEEKQATTDPGIDLKIRRYKRKYDKEGSYYFRLNGLFQFKEGKKGSFEAVLPYDYVFDYTTPGSTGGFGVAKAVILGASQPNPNFELRTQDLYYDSDMAATDQRGEPSPTVLEERIQGTRLKIKDIEMIDNVSYTVTYGQYAESYVQTEDHRGIIARLRDMLASSDTPDITLKLNGDVVEPYFRRGRTYDSPFQRDLRGSSGLAGTAGYPFNQGRDRFNSRVEAKAFEQFAQSVEKEPTIMSSKEDEIFDPDDPASATRPEDQRKMDEDLNAALEDPAIKRALAIGAETAAKVSEELEKEGRRAGAAEGKKQKREGVIDSDAPQQPKPLVGKQGMAGTVLSSDLNEDEEKDKGRSGSDPSRERAERLLQALNEYNSTAYASGLPTIDWLDYRSALQPFIDSGYTEDEHSLSMLYRVLDEVSKAAVMKGGGGISTVAGLQNAITSLVEGSSTPKYVVRGAKSISGNPNPFGKFAGLYISREQFLDKNGKYASAKARRFKENYAKYLPLLILWDQILRIVADTADIKEKFYPGFVLNDNAMAIFMALPSGTQMIGVNPFWFKAVKSGYDNAQEAALYLHAMACHELAHMKRGVTHGDGHDEQFVAIRENLADRSFPAIPGITGLVHKFLGIRIRGGSKAVREADRRIKELEQQVTSGCKDCYKTLVTTLEDAGRVDTVDWLKGKGEA